MNEVTQAPRRDRERQELVFLLRRLLLIVSVIGVAHASVMAQDQVDKSIDDILPTLSASKDLDVRTPDEFRTDDVRWEWSCNKDKTCKNDSSVKYLRLHVRAEGALKGSDWTLLVIDSFGRVFDRLTANIFAKQEDVWTKRVWGREVRLELRASTPPNGLRLIVDRMNYSHLDPEPKAIIGDNDLEDLVAVYGRDHDFYTWSQAVPAIFFQSVMTKKDTNCTGMLLTKDLLMTNHHCISQPWQLRTAEVRFGYESKQITSETFAVSEIILADQELDFSVLRLDRPAKQWSVAQIHTGKIKKDRELVIIQYPNGSLKKISVIGCKVESANAADISSDFFHLCDADGGTSGAPVMERATGKVFGLHHIEQWNYKKKRDQNRSVKIGLILSKIQKCKPTIYDEITSARQAQ